MAGPLELHGVGPGGVAWCVSGRGYAPPSDTPRRLFPNSLMSTGTKTGEGLYRSDIERSRLRHEAATRPFKNASMTDCPEATQVFSQVVKPMWLHVSRTELQGELQ